ncbi:MAG: alanine--glyoxylate aminotransferase family protein [Firmicutes bacterium]|nr:alanine--glyoxylate aminotransferase family protein [Bacillota bacterium]MDD7601841.1 alanine--glyoxylate aminotransferase family protein [Bacillota bacterium]MDY5855857.1 alanine--glyoxylate aminotransferase family protein [Anaerovoracaceae bacterium]
MYQIMTAGPTQVRENVRMARSLECTNPDLDPAFFDFYRETCQLLSEAVNTENKALILGGEGILGLEAACASLTEPGDRVLVIDNGVFGKGFADFVKIYGGTPVSFVSDYHRPVKLADLEAFLEKDSDFKYATVVHLDTPSGVINDVEEISKLLDRYHIMTVADSVAGLFGEKLDLSNSKIDILCGGSQKALSCPPGLTMLWVSDRAFAAMENRKTPIAAFYANILNFKDYYENQWFPYTMPISDIYGLRAALDNYFEMKDTIYERHARIAAATRAALQKGGLKLYLEDGFSNNATAVMVPEGITDQEILEGMRKDYNIMISGCFDVLAGVVVRIGHMGENAYEDKMEATLAALQGTLEKKKIPVACNMAEAFRSELK